MSRGRDPDALLRQRVVLIAGEIDDASATEIIAKMLYLEHLDRRRETYLYVNSQGGSVAAAMAIADTIRAIATPARTVCLGQAQGTAAVILAAGQKGYRFVYPTAVISLLPLTLGSPQSEIDRDDAECELQKWEAAFAKLLAEYTGKTAEETLLACRSSRSFDARQAIEFGLADRLVADSCGSLPGLVSPFQGFDR